MTTTTQPMHGSHGSFHWNWRQFRDVQPTWFYTTIALVALMLFCLVAGSVDERLINGVSVWTKPFKFSLSLAAYFATLIFFVPYLPDGYMDRFKGRLLVGLPVLMTAMEMLYITFQAAQGEASHFNTSTPFHAAMYSLMGFGATVLVAVLVWFGWTVGRHNSMANPMVLAIVLGLVLTFLLGGTFGGYMGNQSSHWVSAATTDADGIWLVKWATDGGDLRVAHFFGMHAMQAIPLFALTLPSSISRNLACTLVITFAAAYSAFTTMTFIQAIQGTPFISG